MHILPTDIVDFYIFNYWWRLTGGVQVLQDAVVHRVQVLDVEGWEWQ